MACHTEHSEVSINSKRVLKFFGYFAIAQYDNADFRFLSKAQNDKPLFAIFMAKCCLRSENV